jgi:hypothetical protein
MTITASGSIFRNSSSAHAGHRHVEQHDVERPPAVSFETFFAGLREIDAITIGGEKRLQHLAHDLLVVNDEYRAFSGVALFGSHKTR